VKLLNIANKDKMVPILNMYIVCVYVVQGESLDSEMWFFFWTFAVSKKKTLTEGIKLSVKVSLRHVFFLRREPNIQALGEFNGRRRPWRLFLLSRQPNPSPRAEDRKLSAKVLITVGQSFAESQTLRSRRRGASPRAADLALAEASSSRWRLCFR
jgi:hypothetical protein